MDISIFLLLYKERMIFKIVFLGMLKDEICTRMKDVLCKHLIRDIGKTLDCVRRIRKYYIKLLPADFQEFKDIVANDSQIVHSESGGLRLDEVSMEGKHLDTIDTCCTSGCKFIRNGTGTAEKVKDLQSLHLVFIIKYIEETFLGKISCRSCLVSLRRQDGLSL